MLDNQASDEDETLFFVIREGFYFPNIHKCFYRSFSSTSFLQVSLSTFFELLVIDFIGQYDTNRFNW